jgi:hypothetical protein
METSAATEASSTDRSRLACRRESSPKRAGSKDRWAQFWSCSQVTGTYPLGRIVAISDK